MRVALAAWWIALIPVVAACGKGVPAPDRPTDFATSAAGSSALPSPSLVAGAPWMLTVGDSITAGFTRDPARAGVNSSWAVQLAERLNRQGRHRALFNPACSGETTITYRTGCRLQATTPLLAGRPQRDVALAAVREHRADLKLIVVALGSNDLIHDRFRTEQQTALLKDLADRLDAIVTELQSAAPGVPVVVATYYDPFENSDPATLPGVRAANDAVRALAARRGARVAEVYAAINTDTAPAPQLCEWIDCAHHDIHPTIAGHSRIADAVAAVLPPGN